MSTKHFILGLCAAILAFPAAAADLPDRIKSAGKVVIATMPNYPPITFKDPATNTLKGFDIELGAALAKEMGVAVEWQEIAFAQMLPSLQTGRVDLVMAGMSDLPGRLRDVFDRRERGQIQGDRLDLVRRSRNRVEDRGRGHRGLRALVAPARAVEGRGSVCAQAGGGVPRPHAVGHRLAAPQPEGDPRRRRDGR